MSVQDARQRTKIYLDEYLDEDSMTFDNDTTLATYTVMYAYPPYPLWLIFKNPLNYDVVYFIDKPTSTPESVDWDGSILGYKESIPIHVHALNKTGLTAEKLLWKAEAELRKILEEHPVGSYRSITVTKTNNIQFNGVVFHGFTLTLNYVRDTT